MLFIRRRRDLFPPFLLQSFVVRPGELIDPMFHIRSAIAIAFALAVRPREKSPAALGAAKSKLYHEPVPECFHDQKNSRYVMLGL
jgi:hypothetical protein